MSKTIIITGAGGFVGYWVTKRLLQKYKVIAITSPFSNSIRLDDIKEKLEVLKLDLSNTESVRNLFDKYKPWAVLHLATHGVYQYQQKDEKRIVIDNYKMAANLLDSSIVSGVEKFINTGSVFEYGSKVGKVKEEDVDLTDILNKYSAVKMATTALANSYAGKIEVITLRPFTVYGPLEDNTRFVSSTIKRAKNNDPIRIVKGVVRDFVYIEDVAEAYQKALETKFPSGQILSIGSGKKHNLDETALLIKKLTNSDSEIVYDESYKRSKESACWADISKAEEVLDWEPKHTILQGIQKMLYFLE